ncbi:hypothetical protein GCM10025857_01720 [Alicyclobacillus contaminans]|nr:hypothetical protein GCM10025857_01720 [Alicyclobacillus contaminans]
MYATSFELSNKFLNDFREFWNLPKDWDLKEEDLEMPTFGAQHKALNSYTS